MAAFSSDGRGAGPFTFFTGFALATDGALGGVVSVLVEPIFIVDVAAVYPSWSWATIRPIAAIATSALLPITAAHSLRSPRDLLLC